MARLKDYIFQSEGFSDVTLGVEAATILFLNEIIKYEKPSLVDYM